MRVLLLLFIGSLLVSANLQAQSQFGSVRGLVTDPTGAVISGAEVRASNEATNTGFGTTSGSSGDYLISGLLPGVYTITVRHPGFRELRISAVTVVASQVARADAALAVGAAAETVTVAAETIRLETQSGALEAQAPAQYILNPATILPPGTLLSETMIPYLAGHTYGGGTAVTAYGSRSSDRRVTLDGVVMGLSGGTGGLRVPRGSVLELQSAVLNANAEHQTSTSSKMFTAKGTNDLHGAVWTEIRNTALEALAWYATGAQRPPGIPTIGYGYRVGGPVYIPKVYNGRNRTFFHTSFEKFRDQRALPIPMTIPSLRMRNGDLGELGVPIRDPLTGQSFAGNIIPADRISPITRNVINRFYPDPGTRAFGNNNFNQLGALVSPFWDAFVRIDQQIGEKNTVSVSYAYNSASTTQPTGASNLGPLTTGTWTSTTTLNFLNVSDTHIISPKIINEFNFGIRMGPASGRVSELNGKTVLSELGMAAPPNAPDLTGGPTFIIAGISRLDFLPETASDERFYTIRDHVAWVEGRFSSRFGFELVRPQQDRSEFGDVFGTYQFSGVFTTSGFGDFLLGLPSGTTRALPLGATGFIQRQTGGFFDEDIRLTKKLNINFGLRFQYNSVPYEPFGRYYNFDTTTGNLVVPDQQSLNQVNPGLSPALRARIVPAQEAGFPSRLVNAQWGLTPRFGFAYQLVDSTVVRGGYGTYNSLQALGAHNGGPFTPGVENYTNVCASGAVACTPQFSLSNPFPGGGTRSVSGLNVEGTNPDLKIPQVHQWNVSVQSRLPAGFVLRTSYVGSKSSQLAYRRNMNLPPPSSIPFSQDRLLYPQWFSVIYTDAGANQSYHALDTEFDRRFANGFTLNGGYTLAKCLSEADEDGMQFTWGSNGGQRGPVIENPYSRARERGNCQANPRHYFRSLGVLELPFGRGRQWLSTPSGAGGGILDAVAGGWSLSAFFSSRTGQWFTPLWNGFDAANTGQTVIRPDRIASGVPAEKGEFKIYDRTAFAQPQPGRYGNSGRGITENLGAWKLDLGAYKTFTFHREEWVPRFRVGITSLNIFNHPAKGTWANSPWLVNNPATAGIANDTIYDSSTTGGLGNWRRIRFDLQVEF